MTPRQCFQCTRIIHRGLLCPKCVEYKKRIVAASDTPNCPQCPWAAERARRLLTNHRRVWLKGCAGVCTGLTVCTMPSSHFVLGKMQGSSNDNGQRFWYNGG